MSAPWAPIRTLACYELASWLRQHGITVKVIDFCHLLTTDELVAITERHIDSSTLAIGVSSTFWRDLTQYMSVCEPEWVCKARERLQHHPVKWLLGGRRTHGSKVFDWTIFPNFAEDNLLKWVREHLKKPHLPDLKFDIYSQSVIFSEDDFIMPSEALPIELGRGCMFKCKFCGYPLGGKTPGTYHRNPATIKEEFLRNYEQWGTTKYYFQDDTVNESMPKIVSLAEIAQSLPFKLEWVGYNRLDQIAVHRGMSQALRDSGLASAFFGIETFQPDAATLVGKGWNGKHGKEFLLKLREEWRGSVTWMLGLIAGIPGDTDESLMETVDWCTKNDMHGWHFAPLWVTARPDKLWLSEFEKNAASYGFTHPNPEKDPEFWVNGDWDHNRAITKARELNKISYPRIRFAGFTSASISSLGMPLQEVMTKKQSQTNWVEIRAKTLAFVKEYANKSLNSR
jgi:radical SAM superfamily enzyme YgiQ (UPF0313 family)